MRRGKRGRLLFDCWVMGEGWKREEKQKRKIRGGEEEREVEMD